MQIEQIATKQDIEACKNEILQALAAFGKSSASQAKTWLRSREVRQMLGGISSGTLQNLRITGALKPSKVNGVMYYRLTEIEALLEKGTRQ